MSENRTCLGKHPFCTWYVYTINVYTINDVFFLVGVHIRNCGKQSWFLEIGQWVVKRLNLRIFIGTIEKNFFLLDL